MGMLNVHFLMLIAALVAAIGAVPSQRHAARPALGELGTTVTTPPLEANVTYQPTWESLDSRPTPSWWVEQKFSLFMHWGLYAVPSYCPVTAAQKTCYAEHFWDTSINNSSGQHAYMQRVYGKDFQYQDFAPMFTCSDFDPQEWARLFKASGARGLTMTSKHHEGWTLWPNPRHANWNAMDTGPHRDLLQEVGDAVRAEGLKFGFYYSLMEWDRQYTDVLGNEGGSSKEAVAELQQRYVNNTMIPDLKDLVLRYNPDVLYTDGEWSWPSDHWQTKPFLAWLFNESPVKNKIAVNDRWGNDCRGKHGGFYVCEYGGEVSGSCITDNPTHPWTAHEGMGKSFGYNRIDIYKPPPYFVSLLVQSVAYGGHLQLNVGPTADGRVPHPQVEILQHMGEWLNVNGEAIWNTTGFPFGIKLGCTTPPAPPALMTHDENTTGYTMIAHTKSASQPGIHLLQGVSVQEAEAWCSSNSTCEGFDYYSTDDSGNRCGKQGAGGLGWNGCAEFKQAVSVTAVDQSNTLYVKPGYTPGHPPPPPPPRQCYTENKAAKTLYVMTNGWPDELYFPSGTVPTTPAPAVSLVGLSGDVGGKYAVASRGNATVVKVPVVSLAKLPPASVASNMFTFKLTTP